MTRLRRALARRLWALAYRVDPLPRTVTVRLSADTTALREAMERTSVTTRDIERWRAQTHRGATQ